MHATLGRIKSLRSSADSNADIFRLVVVHSTLYLQKYERMIVCLQMIKPQRTEEFMMEGAEMEKFPHLIRKFFPRIRSN